MSGLNLIFAGTPDFAAQHLKAILEEGRHTVVAVYSQPDRKSGRGKKLLAPPVKQLALEHNIPVYQPDSLKTEEALAELRGLNADVMVVVAYGMLLPESVLNIPRHGCLNVHASVLPRWRGAAPIERAIEAGDAESGITIMQVDVGLDTGAMLEIRTTPITAAETGDSLRDKLSILGQQGLLHCLQQLEQGALSGEQQDDSLATYAKKLQKAEAALDWTQPAAKLDRKIRAFNSSNLCYSTLYADNQPQRVKIWQASVREDNQGQPPGTILAADKTGITVACGDGALQLQRIQLPGGKALDVAAVLNARRAWFEPGQQFCMEP